MDWIWAIGIVLVMIIAALLWWLFSRNSSSTEAGALTHSPTNPTHGPAEAAGQNPVAGRLPAADRVPAAEPELPGTQLPASTGHREDDGGAVPTAASDAAVDQERRARDTDADRPLGDSGSRQDHVADAIYEDEVSGPADEDMMVEETMPDSPGASGTTTAQGSGTEEPPPAAVEDAAAEQSLPTAEPLYDETEWLGYAGEAVIEPSVAAENGDGPDRRRG
ncbi:hypothetical protein [Arthrobacter sulfonylureivorans]|uniref:Uncharacterized protein n=1 Tax=Arthrobacter sulfonylureivorans TaxID=2486855 RepID=A0ABY3WCX8_9MICC|nr:hypothetical protein [Arthrobacter sulfonylureivorans]UNK47287.1 hypothetical protein MNQ99_08110 [Arthrobacter sulfonylureivorans]